MSIGSNHSFFKMYAKNGYTDKINPEFQGIAKKYYNQKREHNKVHAMKQKLDKEVAYLERVEKNAQKALLNKKKELQQTKEKNNRILNEVRRREWLQEVQRTNLRGNYEKAQIKKVQSQRKIKEAKMFMSQHKRSLADLNRMENQKTKQAKTIKQAQQWDLNRSRVSSINQFTKNVKERTNKFFQSQTSASLSKYQQKIKKVRKFEEYDLEQMRKLQNLKLSLQGKFQKEVSQCDQVSRQIQKIRKEARLQSNLVRSRLRESSSSRSIRSGNYFKHDRHQSENVVEQ